MDRSTLARTGIAGAIAGLGLTVGGIAIASAETGTSETTTASASAHPGGPRGDRGERAEALAEALGLEEDVVRAALQAVRDELRPDTDDDGVRTPPTEAERAARQAALAAALAEELDISEAKVTAALAELEEQHEAARAERRAEARVALVERLDVAVEAGTLTAADKASVLKAYDADLIGGGFRGGPGGAGDAPAT